MSNYTTELRFICESESGLLESAGYNSINEIVESARSKIFSFEYPIFDERYKPTLEKNILKYYYTREICAETYGRWKLFLDSRMNLIMPKYNSLYEAAMTDFNPLYDADYSHVMDKDGTHKTKNTGDTTLDKTGTVQDDGTGSNNRTDNLTQNSVNGGSDSDVTADVPKTDTWVYYSDTPQGGVDGLATNTYLTNATHTTTDGTGSSRNSTTNYGRTVNTTNTGTQNYSTTDNNTRTYNTKDKNNVNLNEEGVTTEDYVLKVKGKFPGKTYASIVKEYRETFMSIDMMVINELSDLFFRLWE